MRKLLVAITLFFAAITVAAALSAPDSPSSTPRPAATAGPVDEATLHGDAAMTQQMSVVGANGPMQRYGTPDAQLTHSQSPAFVGQLERHQADVDRMLARQTP